jgi:transcriptional regulator with XRE-family HTH domain
MYYEKLRPVRKSRGFSGTEVSKILGISKQMVHAWEKGVKKISLENLIKLADLYQVTLDELVGRTPPENLNEEKQN